MKKNLYIICVLLLALFGPLELSAQEYGVNKGYKGSVELGFAAGAGTVGHNRGEFIHVSGYQFNKWLSVGVGVGIQVWQVTQQVTLPLFIDIESIFMEKTISPYVNLRTGYCWGLSQDEMLPKDGVYFSPTVGFRWGISYKMALKLGVGYLMQSSDILQNYHTLNQFEEKIYFHSLIAKVAFEF